MDLAIVTVTCLTQNLSKGHHVETPNEDSEGVYRPKGSRNARMALDRFRTLKAVSRVFGASV